MAKINRENVAEHLIDYQLDMIGKSIQEAHMTKEWYSKWTMTTEQHEAFKAYALPLIKKVFKCNKSRAESTFNWFDLQFGLRIKD
jgi:hypothetical protein